MAVVLNNPESFGLAAMTTNAFRHTQFKRSWNSRKSNYLRLVDSLKKPSRNTDRCALTGWRSDLSLFKPTYLRCGFRPRSLRLPILMYHSISDSPEFGVRPYYRVCTSPARFSDHMRNLSESGWQGVTLSQGLEALEGKARMTRRPVVITFDDGFRDFYTEAFPVLRRHSFSATMYLPTAFIGENRLMFKSRECLRIRQEVRELHRQGIQFGSHTVNHPTLIAISWPDIEMELRLSRERIEQELGLDSRTFAYPCASPQADAVFVKAFAAMQLRLGYISGVTTVVGRVRPSDNQLLLKRLPVSGLDDLSLLQAKLEGAYDWLSLLQSASKRIRRIFRSR